MVVSLPWKRSVLCSLPGVKQEEKFHNRNSQYVWEEHDRGNLVLLSQTDSRKEARPPGKYGSTLSWPMSLKNPHRRPVNGRDEGECWGQGMILFYPREPRK